MATQPRRKRRVEEPHPGQVRAAELGVEVSFGTQFVEPGEELPDDEKLRCRLFLQYQCARLLVKMGWRGHYRFTVRMERKR